MSLPSAWTDKIFAKLMLTYGQRFLGLYSGIDLEAVKADWGHELRGYAQSPQAIKHALEHLPVDKAPNVLEFRELCRRAPSPRHSVLTWTGSAPDPGMLDKAKAALAAKAHPKAWAHALRQREANGAKLTRAQREMWRDALGMEYGAPAVELDIDMTEGAQQ
jgi:hypothetical protein